MPMKEEGTDVGEGSAGRAIERHRPKPPRVLPIGLLVLVPESQRAGVSAPEREPLCGHVVFDPLGQKIEHVSAPGEALTGP